MAANEESNRPRSVNEEGRKRGFYGRLKEALLGSEGPTDLVSQDKLKDPDSIFITSQQPRESTDDIAPISAQLIESTLFNEEWLARTHARARTEGRRSGALIGACLGSIGLLALGPVLMLLCGIAGCIVGVSVGFLYDLNKARRTKTDGQKELGRLTYLVRFAVDQIHRKSQSVKAQTYCCQIIQEVIMEFKPLIMLPNPSPVVVKKLKLFYSFIRDEEVHEYLWVMVNAFLADMATEERLTIPVLIKTCQDIFVPLVEVEKRLDIVAGRRMEVIERVEDFIADPKLEQYIGSSTTVMDAGAKAPVRRGSIYMSPRGDDEYSGLEVQTEGIVRMSSRVNGAFFRNFNDFLKFDIDLKHKMPISDSEFSFLFEQESESLTAPGWSTTVEKKNIKVLRFSPDEESSSVLVRAYARIPNTTAANIFYHIYDPTKRQSWDKNFSAISVTSGDDCEILYCQLQAPFGITPRDFLQYRKALNEGQTCCIIMRSAEHAQHPNVPGFIRAESMISGYVIRQRGPDCDLFLMSSTDIKGLIPKWIVNMVAAKAPAQWVECLTNSCKALLPTQFAGDEERMESFLVTYLEKATGESDTGKQSIQV